MNLLSPTLLFRGALFAMFLAGASVGAEDCAAEVDWVFFPDGPPEKIIVSKGDCVKFLVDTGCHDLWEMRSWGRGQNCNFKDAEQLVAFSGPPFACTGTPEEYIVTFDKPGVYSYGCRLGLGNPNLSHCENSGRNMRIQVLVQGKGNNRHQLRH